MTYFVALGWAGAIVQGLVILIILLEVINASQ